MDFRIETKKSKGAFGETYVAEYLRAQGFIVDVCNYRTKYGEIDIIAHQKELYVFVEVKLRTSDLVNLAELVPFGKQKKIIMTALMYCREKNLIIHEHIVRFDVALLCCCGGDYRLEYITNAFSHEYF